ncbi:bacterial Ig-like domain-containing protein [Lactiplantibacillus pentosus]|uniref:bacterial Ig-like domain-containing protein n=1 Tax=Lactiplantibacillus pentosus TaxID=1589 RepID=UPI001B37DD16|nr:bacterial Ig-like domain-containing protein [Lactiplantibacillus pentosus]MBQ0836523.1 bacterial Ig-like domain-containing protein [Lactiplantibacillus pentosus]
MKNNQEYVMMAARKNRRFWLAAGTALLVWQVNNQTAQADVQQTPTSSADTTVVTANATAASNVVQLQSGAKTSTNTTSTAETTKAESTSPQQAGSDSQATSASGTASSATKTGESGQAASDLTTEAANHAKSESTTPYTDGSNAVENKQNTTAVTTSADKSTTGSQSTTEIGTTPAQSVETDKAGSAGDSVPVDSAAKADQVNDTSLSNDGYNAVGTDVNSSQPSETDKTGTDKTQSSTDGIDSQTVTDEKTSAGLTADSFSSLQPRLAQVQASSLQLDTVDAAPTVAQDYAAWDAITDTTRKGIMGTSEWWIDDSDNTLHLGAGQLADTNAVFDSSGSIIDWGNIGWGNYLQVNDISPKLVLEGTVVAGKSARGLFTKLTFTNFDFSKDVNQFGGQLDTSNTVDMAYLFEQVNLPLVSRVSPSVNLAGLDTSHVTDVSHMFEQCHYYLADQTIIDGARTLTLYVDLDLSKVTNTSHMLDGFKYLQSIVFTPEFTLTNVTDTSYMFNNCGSLRTTSFDTFDISNATDTSYMFAGTDDFVQGSGIDRSLTLYLGNNQTITTNMSHMFDGARFLDSIKFEGVGTRSVTNVISMFNNCVSLTTFDITSLNTSNITDMTSMFAGCTGLSAFDLSALDTSQVKNMSSMFQGCTGLSSINLAGADTSQVENMSSMFQDCTGLSSLDLSALDISKVTNMASMFAGCTGLSAFDLSALDTSQVKNMFSMFQGCTGLSSINLAGADTSQVENMSSMFQDCTGLSSLDLSTLDTSNVTNMSALFKKCTSLVSINLSGLNTSKVTNMSEMFFYCMMLPEIKVSSFDTSKVLDMSAMFAVCAALTRLDLTGFNTVNVLDMTELFAIDIALKTLDISMLDMSHVQIQKGHYSHFSVFRTYSLLNLLSAVSSPAIDTNLTTIKVNHATKLILPEIEANQSSDLINTAVYHEMSLEKILSDFQKAGVSIAELSKSGLRDSKGYGNLWINNATAETLTSEQLMARYDGTNPLATDATWTWQNILGKDLQVISGTNSTWAPKDSLAGLIDTSKTVDDLTTTVTDTATNQTLTSSQLNALLQQPAHLGQYQVAYQYTDGDGTKQISVPVTLSLVANQSLITTKDSVLQLGTTWTAADNIASLLDADGSVTDLTKVNGVVSVNGIESGTVDTTIPGVYQIDYQITDSTGTVRTATATVIVNGLTLKETQVNVSTDDRWDPLTNIDKAIDDQGNEATVELTIMDATDAEVANIKKPGTYQLNYHFTDAHGEHTATAAVNVKADENHADLQVKDSRVYQFGTWTPTDNFVSAMDSDGETLDISALSVTGTVDLNQVGKYAITYQFTDQFGVVHSGQATVEVLENQAAISVDNNSGTLYANGIWNPDSVVVSATDVDGTTVENTKIKCSGTVDVTTPGDYKLTYSFVDSLGEEHSKDTTVTVLENLAGIKVKSITESFRIGAKWSEENNFDSATDVDGTSVDLSNVAIESTVNSEVVGQYKVTYSFTDQQGQLRSIVVPVEVLANLADIRVKSKTESFRIGAKWSAEDNFDSATDVDGTSIDLADVDVVSTVDPKTVGQYKVTYSFTDQQGRIREIAVPVEVLANLADIRVKSKTESFRIGAKWSEKDNLESATDVDGTQIDLADVDIESTVNSEVVGQYKVTYSFTDQQGQLQSIVVPVEVLANLADIRVKSKTESFRIGAKWSAEDNFDSATDVDGIPLGLSNVDVKSTVNTEVVGQYKVTYSFTDQQGKPRSVEVPVEVLANLASIKVKAPTENFRIGAKWSEKDNFDSATDVDGTPIDLADVEINSTVDPEKVGQYKVTYSFTDQQGQLRQADVMVEVLENLAGIKVKSATESFRIDAKWSAEDNFDSATDVDGTPIDLADVEINSTVDPEKVGQYKVTYSFTDQQGQLRQADVMVEVLENLAGIKVKSATESFRIGAKWSKEENFDSATDVDGTSIALSDLDIISTVDSTAVGQYKVTYSFTDQQGKLRSVEVPVDVLANMAGIKVKSKTESFRIGAKWSEKDNFDGATDVDGTPIDLADVDVISTVDPKTVGQYKVTYSFTDQQGELRSIEVPVDVLANLAGIKVKSTAESFRIGAKWSEKDNFDSATDVGGTPVDLADVAITSTVDPEKVGQYKVTYSFTDQQGQLRKAEVPVEVLANLAGIKVKFTTESFRIGAKWSEEDNFDSATDVDGTPINLSNIDIESTVNSEVAGQYKVTYSFTDQQGKLRSAEIPVEVLANLAGIKVKSTTESFRIGAKWSEKDNFDSATDVDGTPINLSNIDIESTVNSEVAGQYKVTYSFTDQQGNIRSVEVPVEVLANLAGIRIKSTTESFRIGAKWSAEDNFDSATDVDGTSVDLADVDIISTVNPKTVGQYKVTYSFTDQQGRLQKVDVKVEVLANLAGIKVKSTTESFRIGAKWSEKDNFDGATDVDGTPIDLADVDVTSTVDPKTVGQYKVTYSFTDQQGQLRKADVKVEVLANLAGIKAKSTTESFRIGAKWSEEDNFDSATDVDGTPIDLADVYITSTVDPKRVGQYKVTYSFTDQQGQFRKAYVTVNVLANLAGIRVKSTTESFRIGAKWSAKDNLDSATDVDGTSIDLADVDITSTVDSKAVGQYKVTYSFTDQQGKLRSVEVPVEVLANLAGIKVKSATESFRIGAKWSAEDNFHSATDVDGTLIDLADVDITSTVDSKAVGQYKVTYSFTDQQGELRSVEVPVEVLANLAGIKAKSATESFRIGAKWSAKDNFEGATDVDGTPIDLADVDITSTVDPEKVGQYKVTYSFTDQQGQLRKADVTVDVLANLAGIRVKSTTESFRIGAKWSEKDNFESATNVDGTAVALSDVDITSTVDPEKVGQYNVTYSFTDQQGQLRKADVTVDVLANLAGISAKSATESFRIGAKWSAKDNFEGATDVEGTPIDLANVDITSTVDPEKVGQYKVTYSFTDQQGQLRKADVTVDVLANLAGIKVKSTTESFRIGAKWSAEDNFDSATDVDGTPIDLADVDITSTVDSKAVGQYKVTYSFTDQQGTVQQVIVPVNVLANYANLQLNQTELSFRAGDNRWQPESNIAAATDIDGRAIDLATMQITNAVDSTTPGTYLVNYAFTDSFNQTHRATATVTVLDNLSALTMTQQHVTLYLGNRQWQPEDNFGGAKNVDGSAITFDQLQVLGHYDLKVVGDYELTYQFTDQLDHLRTAQFTVTVAENQATIVVEKTAVTLHVGDTWEPMMNFVSATDMDGQALAEDRISVNVTKLNQRLRLMMMRSRALPIVDTTVVGSYQVSYQFIDGNGNLQELATTVSVLPNESVLKLAANDITLYAGDEWQPMANVVKATNVDGTPVTADQIRISGSVNPNVVGQYRVLYSFVDQQDKLQQAVTTVNVLANQAALLLKHDQVALTVGDEWQPLTNLQLARDVDGHEIASTDLVIDGQVDTANPGTYQVRYHFTDMRGHEQQAVAMVTVVEPAVVDQALLRLHTETVTLRAGATWAPLSNVAEVLDSDGSAQTSEQVSVQGTVDLNQAGKYLLTYHFLDQLGHDHSATATIIVLENEASLKLRTTAVTLKVGQKWDAFANILAATDVDGRSINEAVVITDDVDWQRPGIYQLTYELVDQQGKLHSAKTIITLIAADDDSGNQGGNGNTDNGSSNQGGNGNTDNGSDNQGGNGNTDNGSGNQGGNGNTDNGSDNQGGNGDTDNGSGSQGGNGNTDNGSDNQGGNGNTDNGSGNQGGNGNTDNGSGNQGGNGNTNDGSSNQGGNGNTDNDSGNQDGNSDADNGLGNQDGNGNTDTNSDNQSTKADDDTVSNDNLNTNHQIDTDTIHDADNNSGQEEVAKSNTVSHENGANATVKVAVAKHQSVTTDSVKSTINTKTTEQPGIGSPTQLPQTDEHTAGNTNWWPWLGIALAGLITMVKPTKKKEK